MNIKLLQTVVWTVAVIGHIQGAPPSPVIEFSGPPRVGTELAICCTAPEWQGQGATLKLVIREIESAAWPVTLNDRSVQVCDVISLGTQYHRSKVLCDSEYNSGSNRRGVTSERILFLFQMADPVISGPATVVSQEEHTWTCTLSEVTYDERAEFSLSWRLDSVATNQGHTSISARGYLDRVHS